MHLSVSLSHPVGRKHVVQVYYGSLQAPLAHPALQAHLYVIKIRLGFKICMQVRAGLRGRLTSYIQLSRKTLSRSESLYKVACLSVLKGRGSVRKVGPPDESLFSSSPSS